MLPSEMTAVTIVVKVAIGTFFVSIPLFCMGKAKRTMMFIIMRRTWRWIFFKRPLPVNSNPAVEYDSDDEDVPDDKKSV